MEIKMPKLGLTMTEGTLTGWLVAEGDAVEQGEILFEFESDKSTMEFEAPQRGVVQKIMVAPGTEVPCGTVVAILQTGKEPSVADIQQKKVSAPAVSAHKEAGQVFATPLMTGVYATPAAKRRARELGVNLAQLRGRGVNGRVHLADVETAAVPDHAPAEVLATPVARRLAADLGVNLHDIAGRRAGQKIGREDVIAAVREGRGQSITDAPSIMREQVQPGATFSSKTPLSGVRKLIADHMQASASAAPHVTLHTEVDATQLVDARRQLNDNLGGEEKISFNALLVAIVSRALREFPQANACLLENEICIYADINIGLAVDTERGLLVPVVHRADRLSVREIQEVGDRLITRALEGKSLPDDLAGGTFTITNLGMMGIDAFTPIINQPQAAILGVGRILNKPVGEKGELVLRDRITLSLSFDHRLIDGAPAARLLQRIGGLVERPYALLL